jgi:hypothetical protein
MRAFSKYHRVRPPEDKSLIIFVAENLSECSAWEEEKRLISLYGRIDRKTGCLRNLTDGGEGPSGRIPYNKGKRGLHHQSAEWVLRHSEMMKEKWSNPLFKENYSAKMTGRKGHPRTEQWRQRQADAIRGRIASKETRQKQSESLKAAYAAGHHKRGHSEETRTKIRAAAVRQINRGAPPRKELPCHGCGIMLCARERSKRHSCGATNRY